jgi:hypothetical protein
MDMRIDMRGTPAAVVHFGVLGILCGTFVQYITYVDYGSGIVFKRIDCINILNFELLALSVKVCPLQWMELQDQLLGSRADRVCIDGFDAIIVHNCCPEIGINRCHDKLGF